MALSGMKIQKLLPKTNCKDCGSNTCLAFAMKLASKKAELSECPHASDEAKKILGAASEPPVKGVSIGGVKLGEETVLYRHEKTFINQTAIAININDDDKDIDPLLEEIGKYELDRVGELLSIDFISLTQKSLDAKAYAELAGKISKVKPVIIKAKDTETIKATATTIKEIGGIIASATPENATELSEIAKENKLVLSLTAENLNDLTATSTKIKAAGFNELILEYTTMSLAEQFQVNSLARKAALKDSYKALGYASISYIQETDVVKETVIASTEITKYGGVIVLPRFDKAQLVSLMTLRQNIYTDPQKPIQVEPKLYPVGEPTKDSPVFVTTNFSLTYFIVSGEIENTGVSAWLVVPECEGMSVLTAWAAGKFGGAAIAKSMKEMDVEGQVNTRELIIPGYVAQISGELQESLPGWTITVGPQEAADIESFVKNKFA